MEKAKQEASDIVSKANALVEKTVKEIKEKQHSTSEVVKEFKKKSKEIKKEIEAKEPEQPSKIDKSLKKGDYVSMEDSTSVGEIIELDAENKTAVVEFNGLKFRVLMNQLKKAKKEKEKKREGYVENISFDAKTRLDLRGMRAEAALRELDDFISDSIVNNNLGELTIIHGKGTGALRIAVHDFLSNHHHVKSFRLGELVEGGAGVTIVNIS